MRGERKGYNHDLPPLPDDLAFLRAVAEVQGESGGRNFYNATASRIAGKLGVSGARRLGRGAVAHSWTGTMSASLRVSPRLLSLCSRGLLDWMHDEHPTTYRKVYLLTKEGRKVIE